MDTHFESIGRLAQMDSHVRPSRLGPLQTTALTIFQHFRSKTLFAHCEESYSSSLIASWDGIGQVQDRGQGRSLPPIEIQ